MSGDCERKASVAPYRAKRERGRSHGAWARQRSRALGQLTSPGRVRAVRLIHTCYRITDPERSVAFYEALGLEKRREIPIRDEAINIFMGVPGEEVPELELTHNYGVDGYELGTAYGHVALTVDDLDVTLEHLKEMGIEPEKPPYRIREGGSRLCFVRDPDDYRIELLELGG
jgi:lactoylglutathione lyase